MIHVHAKLDCCQLLNSVQNQHFEFTIYRPRKPGEPRFDYVAGKVGYLQKNEKGRKRAFNNCR